MIYTDVQAGVYACRSSSKDKQPSKMASQAQRHTWHHAFRQVPLRILIVPSVFILE